MTKSHFTVMFFSEHLGDKATELNVPSFKFVGNQTTVKSFNIAGVPTEAGYLIIQAFDVQNLGHEILINGKKLPGVDIVRTRKNEWQDSMDVIPEGFLHQGKNTIQIKRASGGDNILIGSVVIHWKEQEIGS